MNRSIACHIPLYVFNLTIYCSKNFATKYLLTIGHMAMFVVKSIVILFNGQGCGSINCALWLTRSG